jgi:transcriptional regulator with XRE-family HTH domain
MDQLKQFGKRSRMVRKAAKITREEAAEKAELNPKYLGQIERGEKRPSFEAIMALAKALSVEPEVLFRMDPGEADEKGLRKNIETLLRKCGQQDLRRVYKVIKALVEP